MNFLFQLMDFVSRVSIFFLKHSLIILFKVKYACNTNAVLNLLSSLSTIKKNSDKGFSYSDELDFLKDQLSKL